MEFKITCTSLNLRIKEYVNILFSKFDDEKDDKLYFNEFEKWTKKHPVMIDCFDNHFSTEIWAADVDEISNRD